MHKHFARHLTTTLSEHRQEASRLQRAEKRLLENLSDIRRQRERLQEQSTRLIATAGAQAALS